jgi:uncharacterized protein YjiS (DUF1127 family)
MALLDLTRVPGRSASVTDRFFDGFTQIFGAASVWNDARRTRNALSQLSAHELDDIGLCRGDIDTLALKRRF